MATFVPLEEKVLFLIQGIFSGFSVFGCSFMVLAALTLKRPRKPKTQFVIGLAFSKLLPSIVMFSTDIVLYNSTEEDNELLCEVEAGFIQLFFPISWLYTVCISMLMWMRIRGVPEDKYPRMTKILHIVSWVIPVLILLSVVAADREDTLNWCWLSTDAEARHIEILLYFFIPMATLYVVNLGIVIFAYYKARKDFWNNSELSGLITRSMKMKVKRQMEKLVSYPIVFLACYTFPVIDRFYNFKHPGSPIFVLSVLHSIMALDGFLTALVFGLTRSVNRRLVKRVAIRQTTTLRRRPTF